MGSSEEGLHLAKGSACTKAQRPVGEWCDWERKEVQPGWSIVSERAVSTEASTAGAEPGEPARHAWGLGLIR